MVHEYGSYCLLILRSDVEEEHVLCIQFKVDGTVKPCSFEIVYVQTVKAYGGVDV